MCGRFALHASEEEILSHFHLKQGFSMRSRYNLCPTQTIPIICQWGQTIEFARWGFIPSWTKSDVIPAGHINARLETLFEKPSFKTAIKQQRCLIPASGYYEWQHFAGKKQPYYIHLQTGLFAFAGIWSNWRAQNGDVILSCAIITTIAQEPMQKLHERMPVILAPDQYKSWLIDDLKPDDLAAKFLSQSVDNVRIYAVSQRMSHPQFEGIECIKPL
jgi:putative SOS response-associated peptidase YedK